MLSRATIDAAARVTEYVAGRPIAFNLSIMPMPPADDAGPAVNDTGDATAAGPDRPQASPPHTQGNPDVQRDIAAR